MIEIIKNYWDYLKDIIIFILGIISKCIFNYIKNKYDNKKSLKEHISTIKFVCKNIFSENEIKLFKYLVNNEKYKFDEKGLCIFKYNSDSNKNDKEFIELVIIANKDNEEKRFYCEDDYPLFFIKEKQKNECIIYMNPILIEMIKNNEF